MINVELYFNGKKVVVDDAGTIAATYALNTLGEIKNRQGARTNRYTLPLTNANKKVFDNAELVNNESALPYSVMEHYVFIEGTEVFSGFAVVEASEEGYEVSAYAGNSDFFNLIKNKSIRDLDLSIYNHVRNDANIEASWENTEGYIYAFLDYGKYKTLDLVNEDGYVLPQDLYPSVYWKTILEAIAKEAGYTLTGNVLNDAMLTKRVVPYQYSKNDSGVDYGFKGSRMPRVNVPVNNYLSVDFTEISDPFNSYSSGYYTSPVSQNCKINFSVDAAVQFDLENPFRRLYIEVVKRPKGNTDIDYNAAGTVVLYRGSVVTGVTVDKVVNVSASLLEGEQVFVFVAPTFNTVGQIGFNYFEIVTDKVLNTYGVTWEVAKNLPDIKQDKFFLDFLVQFNLLVDADYNNGLLRLEKFDSIENKEPVNWSKKIDFKKKPRIEYRFNEYAQTNKLTYKTDDVLTDGFSHDFIIADSTLEDSKTAFESSFFLPPEDFIFNGLIKVASPLMLTLKQGLQWRGQWLSTNNYLTNDIVYYAPSGSWHKAKRANIDKNPLTLLDDWQFVGESDVWDIKNRSICGTVKDDLPLSVLFSSGPVDINKYISTSKMDWSFIYDNSYKVFSTIVNKTKVVTLAIRLNYADINQLDLTRPVYLEEYNANFYLDEVKQFKFNESDSTLCRLIKI